ncbi:hypothetical protein [Sphingomonas humi]
MNAAMNALGPDWLAHRYDPTHDAVHLRRVDRATRARVPFLTDEELGGPGEPQVIRRADLAALRTAAVPAQFIFHSAYCCSTLLANAYDRPGQAFSLKEPVILNDLVGWRHRGAPPERLGPMLGEAVELLARPFERGERCIIKPSNVVNGFAPALLAMQPEARALLLYAPLEVYLGSIAKKGLWGRRWVRDLLSKQLREQLVLPGFSAEDYFLQTDLQVAAVGWLAQHALYHRLAAKFPERVRSLDSEVLLERPHEALAALDQLFGVACSDEDRGRVIATVFSRNAKNPQGERYSAADRKAAQVEAVGQYEDEIAKVLEWARAVAENAGVPMSGPLPLLG